MTSDSEVIITDGGDAVRHKVIVPVRQLLKKQSLCQKHPGLMLLVFTLGFTLMILILICICYDTYGPKPPPLPYERHSASDFSHHMRLVDYVNDPTHGAQWKAVYNKFASRGVDDDEDKTEPGAEKSKEKDNEVFKVFDESKYAVFGDTLTYLPKLVDRADIQLPKSFDSRVRWPLCSSVHRIYNQGSCGSCWAVSAASAISDRICIQTNCSSQPQISSRDLLSCCPHCGTLVLSNYSIFFRCGGATWPLFSFTHWKTKGIVTGGSYGSFEGCKPYDKPSSCGAPCHADLYTPHESEKLCERQCQPLYERSYEEDLSRAQIAFWIKPIPNADEYFPDYMRKIRQIVANVSYSTLVKREVYLNGPVMGCFPVFDEFQHYRSGIYNKTSPDAKMLYGHCAKLLGWGVESGTEYWLYANSWGKDWGENGFFRVRIENLPEEVAAGNIW